jgi:hypothetical protein
MEGMMIEGRIMEDQMIEDPATQEGLREAMEDNTTEERAEDQTIEVKFITQSEDQPIEGAGKTL